MMVAGLEREDLLYPGEMAKAWRVDVQTLARWARAGQIRWIRTPGGVRRYPKSELPAWDQGGGHD